MVIKTLVVDDNKLFLKKTSDHLESHSDLCTFEASSPQEGLNILDEEEIDVIVSDYLMPDMDGIEFLEKVREEKEEQIPFIMFTGKGQEKVAMESLNLGANRYLRKDDEESDSQFEVLAKAIVQEYDGWKAGKKLKENERKLKQLYEMAPKIEKIEDPNELYELMIETAKDILDFDVCSVEIKKDEELVVKASTEEELVDGYSMSIDKGIAGKTFRNKESYLISDVSEEDEAEPTDSDFESAISIPMGDIGVFQALSYEEDYYDHKDLELAELFVSYMTEAIKGVKSSQALKESVNRFRTIIERSVDAIFLTDQNGYFTYANQTASDLLGYSKEEIREMKHDELFIKKDQKKNREMLKKLFEKGEIFTETTLIKKDGEEVTVELNSVSLPSGMVYDSCRDISEKKREIEFIEESNEKFRKLSKRCSELLEKDNIEDIISFGIEVSVKLLDFKICEIIIPENNKMISVIRSEDYPQNVFPNQSKALIEDSVAGNTYLEDRPFFVDFEDPETSSDQESLPKRFRSAISVPISGYGVFQAFSVEKDHFTEVDLTLAEALAKHLSKAIKQAKEKKRVKFFNTLLAEYVGKKTKTIQDNIHTVKKNIERDEDIEKIKIVEEAAKDIQQLRGKINTLKDVGDKETIGSVDISWLLKPVVSEYGEKLEKAKIELESEIKDIEVEGGPLLKEAFSNLLENSIKHSGCDNILLSIEEEEEQVIVKVEDDGIGISDDIKEKVFGRGFKKGDSRGAGIGLYLVEKITKSYGGSVQAKDSELGGARFDIYLNKA